MILENVVPESEASRLLAALKRLIDATPVGSGNPERAAARELAEATYSAYVGRTVLKPWVITYHHRHGTDVAVVLSAQEPDGEAYYADDYEPDRDDEQIEVECMSRVSVAFPEGEDPQQRAVGVERLAAPPEPGGRNR